MYARKGNINLIDPPSHIRLAPENNSSLSNLNNTGTTATSFWTKTEISLPTEWSIVATTMTDSAYQTVIFDFLHLSSQASPRFDLALHNSSTVTSPWRSDGKRHEPHNNRWNLVRATLYHGCYKWVILVLHKCLPRTDEQARSNFWSADPRLFLQHSILIHTQHWQAPSITERRS